MLLFKKGGSILYPEVERAKLSSQREDKGRVKIIDLTLYFYSLKNRNGSLPTADGTGTQGRGKKEKKGTQITGKNELRTIRSSVWRAGRKVSTLK